MDLSGESTLYFLQSNLFSTHKSKCCQSRWRKLSYKTHSLLYIIIYSLNGSKIHHCKPWCCFLSPIAIAKSQSWDYTIPRHSNWTKLAPDPVEDPEVVPPAQEGDIQTGRRSWLKETKVASPAEDPKVPPAQNTEEEKDSPDDPA